MILNYISAHAPILTETYIGELVHVSIAGHHVQKAHLHIGMMECDFGKTCMELIRGMYIITTGIHNLHSVLLITLTLVAAVKLYILGIVIWQQ